jgi:hypothetical protein
MLQILTYKINSIQNYVKDKAILKIPINND